MEYQEKIALLKKYREASKMVEYYKRDLEQYRVTNEQAKSQHITGMPVAHGSTSDLSDYIVALGVIRDKMYSKMLQAERMKLNILVWTESLEDVDERLVINYHYIHGNTFDQIAEKLVYNKSTIKRKHKSAVNNLPDPERNDLWL